MDMMLFLTVCIGIITIAVLLLKIYFLQKQLKSEKREYEKIIISKAKEMAQIVEELRATQIKLMESGKISALASLSAGIIHQVSQPVTAIHGFAKFLKKEMSSQDVFYKPICLIEEQTVYIKSMLEDLMDLIRHREIRKENISANDVIYKAVNLLKDELRIRRIQWELALDKGIPLVYADGVHLQQIFMNIIINAIQALSELPREHERTLEVTTSFERENHHVKISFQDSGPGIQDKDIQRIFDPFYSKRDKGAGIGLALCHDLICEHGGTISVDQGSKKGANFVIKLPAVAARDSRG